jgi:hypothetical protein
MASSRVSPKDTIKIRRGLPKVGDKVLIEVEVTRVDEDAGVAGRVTYVAPGSPIPVTVSGSQFRDGD